MRVDSSVRVSVSWRLQEVLVGDSAVPMLDSPSLEELAVVGGRLGSRLEQRYEEGVRDARA